MQASGYGAYQRIQAETSSPGELVSLLYDALIKNLQRAELALREGDGEGSHGPLVRSQEIVLELIAGLNPEAGELAGQLSDLYQYFYGRLVTANVQKTPAAVLEVLPMVERLRQAWGQIAGQPPLTPDGRAPRAARAR